MSQLPVLASDLDGTLATNGRIPLSAQVAVSRYRAAGGVVVLVTGRRVPELHAVFPGLIEAVDVVVAENGGVLLRGTTLVPLGPGLPPHTAAVLAAHAVGDPELGEVLVSVDVAFATALRAAADELGPDWVGEVVLNKDRAMLVPTGVDKGTGLAAAMAELGRPLADVVAVGDGENDAALLSAAGTAIAVADAVPALRELADRVTQGAASAGVVEVLSALLGELLDAE